MLRRLICVLTFAVVCTANLHKPRSANKRSSTRRRNAATALALSPHDWRPLTTSSRERLDEWRSTLFSRTMTTYRDIAQAVGSNVEPPGPFRFELFSPFIKCPDNHAPVRFGADKEGVGGVLLCADLMQEPDCVVFLSGVSNHTLIIKDIFKYSWCSVVTFDCRESENRVRGRHALVNKCLGTQSQQDTDPNRWTTVPHAANSLNLTRLDALIMDIEGGEYDVFSDWSLSNPDLPRQIFMELHYDDLYAGTPGMVTASDKSSNLVPPLHIMTLSDLALFVLHMTGFGFGIASREDSLTALHASGLTLVRVA